MADRAPAFEITPARVGFFLSLVTVATLFWNVASYFKGLEHKDDMQGSQIVGIEKSVDTLSANVEKLTGRTDTLTEVMTRLTTAIELNGEQKRADSFIGPRSTSGIKYQ